MNLVTPRVPVLVTIALCTVAACAIPETTVPIEYLGAIHGRVVQRIGEDLRPIAEATCLIEGSNRVVATDQAGEFVFDGVTDGAYLIICYRELDGKIYS